MLTGVKCLEVCVDEVAGWLAGDGDESESGGLAAGGTVRCQSGVFLPIKDRPCPGAT